MEEGLEIHAAPRAGTPRKIIQLVVSRNALIALTDLGEIWVLHGLDAVAAGTNLTETKWRPLTLTLPPIGTVVTGQTAW
jgi:hypothetical protein